MGCTASTPVSQQNIMNNNNNNQYFNEQSSEIIIHGKNHSLLDSPKPESKLKQSCSKGIEGGSINSVCSQGGTKHSSNGEQSDPATANYIIDSEAEIEVPEEINQQVKTEQGSPNEKASEENLQLGLKDIESLNLVQQSFNNFTSKYKLIKPIGKGGCGEVFLAELKSTQQARVIKSIAANNPNFKEYNAKLYNEAKLISSIDHPNIVKIFDICREGHNTYMVMEYLKGGSLYHHYKNPEFKTMRAIASITKQILLALKHLHSKGIAHRDVKLENIVFTKPEPSATIKLIDFGIALQKKQDSSQESNQNFQFNDNSGTVFYMSPEVYSGKHDFKCDIWALGVIFYVFLAGELPFKGKKYEDVRTSVLSKPLNYEGPKWDINTQALGFLKRLLERDVSKRYSAEEALNDPFILKYAPEKKLTMQNLNKCLEIKPKTPVQLLLQGIDVYHLQMNSIQWTRNAQLFYTLDADQDGYISKDDVQKQLLHFYGRTSSQIEANINKIFDGINVRKSEKISFMDYQLAFYEPKENNSDKRLLNYCQFLEQNSLGAQKNKTEKSLISIEDQSKTALDFKLKISSLCDFLKEIIFDQGLRNKIINYITSYCKQMQKNKSEDIYIQDCSTSHQGVVAIDQDILRVIFDTSG